MVTAFFMGLPIAFLLYLLVIYVWWRGKAEPDDSFARDYWYTDKNPLHRSWWPLVALLVYMLLVIVVGAAGLAE